MGTEITLNIGSVKLTYAKNDIGMDHSSLFQELDRKRYKSDAIDYDYFNKIGEEPVEIEMAFVRQLKSIVPRIELLGFTLKAAADEYAAVLAKYKDEYAEIYEGDSAKSIQYLTFEEFSQFVTKYPLSSLNSEFIQDFDLLAIRGRFSSDEMIQRLPWSSLNENASYSEASYFGNLIEILHPYLVLRILAQNDANLDTEVVWQYGPLVSSGWANSSDFVSQAKRHETFLIATEGSSDTHILKHALRLLRPEVLDFFRFIDVEEGHPFSGTGNLLKFAEGLIKIDVQNNMLFLFDNDAEGYDAYTKLKNKSMPSNMSVSILPDIPELRDFPTLGPEGEGRADINSKAAAIECYLDLDQDVPHRAIVIWTNYKKETATYQGSLQSKESHTKVFLKQTTENISKGNYDTRKLEKLLDSMMHECKKISEERSTLFKGIFY